MSGCILKAITNMRHSDYTPLNDKLEFCRELHAFLRD